MLLIILVCQLILGLVWGGVGTEELEVQLLEDQAVEELVLAVLLDLVVLE